MDWHKFLQLKGNTIPHRLVPLERLFNKDDIVVKQMAPEMDDQVQELQHWIRGGAPDDQDVKRNPLALQTKVLRSFQNLQRFFFLVL